MLTFVRVEFHLVYVAPFLQLSQVPLEVLGIPSTVNCSIDDCVVGKEPNVWADVLTYIIYEEQKQDRAEHRPLGDTWGHRDAVLMSPINHHALWAVP